MTKTDYPALLTDMYHDALKGIDRILRNGNSVEKLEAYKRMQLYDREIAWLIRMAKQAKQ